MSNAVTFSGITGFNVAYATFGGLAGNGNLTINNQAINLSIGNNNQNTIFSGLMTQGAASIATVTKIGTGTLTLDGQNTFLGNVVVNSGVLQTAVPNALVGTIGLNGGNNITVNGAGVLDLLSLNQIALSVAGNGTIFTGADPLNSLSITGTGANGPSNAAFAGTISGGGGLTKGAFASTTSNSVQILTGFNTYTGPTTVFGTSVQNNSVLELSFTNLPGTSNNIVSSQSALVLSGGTVIIQASDAPGSTANQTFNGTVLMPGSGSFLTLQNTTGNANLNVNLGAITRGQGSVLTVQVPFVAPYTLTTTSAGTIVGNNILTDAHGTAYATTNQLYFNAFLNNVNLQTWAGVSAGSIVPVTATFNPISSMTTATNAVYTLAEVLAPNSTLGSINFAAGVTLTLSGTNSLASGGILVSNNVGGQSNIQGGIIQGPSGGEFVITKPTVGQNIQIQSILDNFGGNPLTPTGLTVNVPGQVFALNSISTYNGPTNIIAGTFSVGQLSGGGTLPTQNASISNTSSVYVNTGAVLNFNTLPGLSVVNAPIVLSGTGNITIDPKNNGNIELLGNISGSSAVGNAAINFQAFTGSGSPGTLTLGGVNTYVGTTTISTGSLVVANNLALMNTVTTVTTQASIQFTTQAPNVYGLNTAAGGASVNLSVPGTTYGGTGPNSSAVALTVGNNNGAAMVMSAILTDFGADGISVGGSLIKVGTNTLTLSPTFVTGVGSIGSTYTGSTTVANGGLILTFATGGNNTDLANNGVLYNNSTGVVGGPNLLPAGALILGGSISTPRRPGAQFQLHPGRQHHPEHQRL